MSNPIIAAQAFDPFKDMINDGKRLRLKDGQLTVEDSTVRSSASGWSRFWTRGQYSQTAILKKMGKIYKKSQLQLDEAKQINFVKNFLELENRAKAQNEAFKDRFCVTRFFLAKSFIDVSPIRLKIEITSKIICQRAQDKINAEAQAAQKKLDDQFAAQQKAQAEAAKEAEREAELKPIKDEIAMIKEQIEELENCPIDVFLKNTFDRPVEDRKHSIEVQEMIDHNDQKTYDNRTSNLKFMLSMNESVLESLISKQKVQRELDFL